MNKREKQIVAGSLRDLRDYAALKLEQHRLDYSEDHAMVQTAVRMMLKAEVALAIVDPTDSITHS